LIDLQLKSAESLQNDCYRQLENDYRRMNMIMEGSSILGMIISGLWITLIITLPILVIIIVARMIRRMVSPHDKEMQQLLEKAVSLLEENNRLLNQQIAGKYSEEKQATAPPAGAAL
jgi:hypothetical protein